MIGESTDRMELTTDQDVFYDFCMWEYRPRVGSGNKFRSVNLLFHSFEVAGLDKRVYRLVQAIREGIGMSRTVWGVKQSGGKLAWEFYFYDYRRREREISMTRLLDIFKPFVSCERRVNENHLYFMFSVDINTDFISGTGNLEEIHMYIGNPGSTVSSGICYSLTQGETRLENFYFFFDTRREREDILAKIACSAHVDSTVIGIDQILRPELRDCKITVVANKQQNDSVYFSGINVDQLIFFLKKLGHPGEVVSFVEENRSRLDHLQYDVGFDYHMEGKDLLIVKSGYYGFF
ncbi:MAG: hypothetical protein JXL84_18490 [Deltaproteobacteria bacterium]|nr:hypothetical protein [Deltaproteobacteria bacterium]